MDHMGPINPSMHSRDTPLFSELLLNSLRVYFGYLVEKDFFKRLEASTLGVKPLLTT